MKNLLLVVCIVSTAMLVAPVRAQDSVSVVETSSHNIFTGLFQSVWARLKALNPSAQESANTEVVYTASIDLTHSRLFEFGQVEIGIGVEAIDDAATGASTEDFRGFLQWRSAY